MRAPHPRATIPIQNRFEIMSALPRPQVSEAPTLPERLRAFRVEHGLSVNKLAEVLAVPAYTVRRWEVGTSRPSMAEASRLVEIGLGPIAESETNATSRSRTRGAGGTTAARQAPELGLAEFPHATGPAWMQNGPPDQEPFHRKLIELQLEGMRERAYDAARLSLIDHFGPEQRTSQAELEAPRPTAVSWSSNYGSHGWHRYIGRFPPHLVRALLNHFGATSDTVVCDPFAGSGTTAVECRLLGIPFVGIEICALSHLMGRVKAGFDPDHRKLVALADQFERYMQSSWTAALLELPENYSVEDVLRRTDNVVATFTNIEKWFTPQALLGVSLTMTFGRNLEGFERDALHLALSAKMRSIGNLDVDVVRAEYSKKPRENVDVARLVTAQLRKMARDVSSMTKTHKQTIGGQSSITLYEGSALEVELPAASLDVIITSPPYGVEAISYLRTHLLSYRSLSSVLSHDPYETREQTIGSEYLEEAKLPAHLAVAAASPTFRAYFGALPTAPDKNSRLRQVGMMKFFEDIHSIGGRMAHWLKDGGRMAFVIGNKRLGDTVAPADLIIEESFKSHGLHLYDSVRHKLKTNNSNSQVPWQERIIQEEATMLFCKTPSR